MPAAKTNIEQLAVVCEDHFAQTKRDFLERAVIILSYSDVSRDVLSNMPGKNKYWLDGGKLVILAEMPESEKRTCEAVIGYLRAQAHCEIPFGGVSYSGKVPLRFKQTDAPHGTLAITQALTNIQSALQNKQAYVFTTLEEIADQTP